MNKVALIIIYNHQYNKNIEISERIYKSRFSNIYHLVPFYNGNKSNVITVYESSFYFQGYLAQGFKSFYREEFSHYFFIADDLFLNPVINEKNYTEHLQLKQNTCFLPGFVTLHNVTFGWWPRVGEAFRYKIKVPGVEAENQLPDFDTALAAFEKFGLKIKPLCIDQVWKAPASIKEFGWMLIRNSLNLIRKIKSKVLNKKHNLSYPLVGSYADIFIVSSDAIKQFCHYCGVFAATKLFVEVGLPTSLVLSAQEIVTEKDLKLQGKALWTNDQLKILDNYENKLSKLSDDFPGDCLYLHPVKLSKWDSGL
jgi:hypothetical protein